MKIVIVGANHKGITVANTLLDHHPDHRVVMIDQNTSISYLGCGTALWVDWQIDSYQGLFYTKRKDFEKKGVSTHTETMVRKIDFEGKVILCEKADGRASKESYDKLILVMDFPPIAPDLPGRNLEHISLLKLSQGGQNVGHLISHMNVQHVVAIGAGYIGVEAAEATIRRGKEVKLFDIANTFLVSYYDEWLTENMDRPLEEKGIEAHFKEQVLAFLGTASVERIVMDHGKYKTDLAINTIGFRPNTVLGMKHLKLLKNRVYHVGRHQRAGDPDVYAVGDCVAIYSNALKGKTHIASATDAVRSGVVAGYNVGGTALEETGVQSSNGISVLGYHMVSTGLNVKAAQKSGLGVTYMDFEDLQRPGFMKKNTKMKVRIVYERNSRRIAGAQVASAEDISMRIHMLFLVIGREVMIDRLKLLDLLLLPHFNQPYNCITMAALSTK